jgi:hypothetical protein
VPRTLQMPPYGPGMNDTRYDHTNASGGSQDQGERKDEGWTSRQGGRQSRDPGRKGPARPSDAPGDESRTLPPPGTNTQGELAGIGEAAERSAARLERDQHVEREGDQRGEGTNDTGAEPPTTVRERDLRGAGTDQPPRMGGPLGPDADDPHLPEGAQDSNTRGSGAGGFDRGVDAKNIGAVHQGVRVEEPD